MRRIAIFLVTVAATLGLMAPAASADALIEQELQVAPEEINHLLSVCVTSRSLIPNGLCIVI